LVLNVKLLFNIDATANGGVCEHFNFLKNSNECELLTECETYDRSCIPFCTFGDRENSLNGDCTFPGICLSSGSTFGGDNLEVCSKVSTDLNISTLGQNLIEHLTKKWIKYYPNVIYLS